MRFFRKKADYFRPPPFLPYSTSPVCWSTTSNYLKNYLNYLLTPYFQVSNKIIKPLIPNHPNNLHSIPHFTCVFTLVLDPWLWILFSQVFPVNILFNYASFFAYCKPFLSYPLWYYYWYEFGWWMIFEWRFPLTDLIHTFSEVSRKKKGDK